MHLVVLKTMVFFAFNEETGARKESIKVKGITLDYDATQLVNLNTLKFLVFDAEEKDPDDKSNKVVIPTKRRRFDKTRDFHIYTHIAEKNYSLCIEKRWLSHDNSFITYPYGY